MVRISNDYIPYKGNRICYRSFNTVHTSKACVFLHGFGGNAVVWDYLASDVQKLGYAFIAIDLPGHGKSFRFDEPMLVAEFSESVKTVIEHIDFKDVTVIGHCLGAMVALDLSLSFPRLITKNILLNGSCRLPLLGRLSVDLFQLFKWLPIGPDCRHYYFSRYQHTGNISLSRFYKDVSLVGICTYAAVYAGIRNWNVYDHLTKVKTPTVLIAGRRDTILPLKLQKEMFNKIPDAQLIETDFDHVSPINSREQLKSILLKQLVSGK